MINLQERGRSIELIIKGENVKGVGLGSAKQMAKIIEYIEDNGKLSEYLERFKILLKGVYKDDFLIYIKSNDKFLIYLIENSVFIEIILERVAAGFSNMRIEGNAIRVTNLSDFIKRSAATFDYDFKTCIPNYNDIESLLINSNHSKLVAFRGFISLT